MFSSTQARPPARRSSATVISLVVGVAVMVAAVVGFLGDQQSAASFVSATSEAPALPPRQDGPGADGSVPDGVTVFDDDIPAVANLDADLLAALRLAATDAADEGITLVVTSGWRSAGYQDQLLRDAVTEYGSAAEAARWVATPDTSPHVQGAAIDVGPWAAISWLSEHGAAYGLCQVYANESWHYELRPDAVDGGCPAMYTDPTQDPRMQQ